MIIYIAFFSSEIKILKVLKDNITQNLFFVQTKISAHLYRVTGAWEEGVIDINKGNSCTVSTSNIFLNKI